MPGMAGRAAISPMRYGQNSMSISTASRFPAARCSGLIEQPIINSELQGDCRIRRCRPTTSMPQFDRAGRRPVLAQRAGRDPDHQSSIRCSVVPPACRQRRLERQRVHVFRGAAVACGCEQLMVYARLFDRLSPGRPQCAFRRSRRPPCEREYGSDKTTNVEVGVRSTPAAGCVLDGRRALSRRLEEHSAVRSWSTASASTAMAARRAVRASNGSSAILPVQGLKFEWTGAYTDAKLTSPAAALNANSGDPLPYAPKWSTALDGEYDWALFADLTRASSARPGAMSARAAATSRQLARDRDPPGQIVLAEL